MEFHYEFMFEIITSTLIYTAAQPGWLVDVARNHWSHGGASKSDKKYFKTEALSRTRANKGHLRRVWNGTSHWLVVGTFNKLF